MSVYVVVTKPGYEKIAARHIRERGVVAYLPLSHHFRRAGRRKARHGRAILHGYVLVWSGDAEREFDLFRHAEGVMDAWELRDTRPCKLGQPREGIDPIACLTAMLVMQSFGYFDATLVRRPAISIGQMVRVVGTMWAGSVGKVVGVSGSKAQVAVEGRFIHGKIGVEVGALEDHTPKVA